MMHLAEAGHQFKLGNYEKSLELVKDFLNQPLEISNGAGEFERSLRSRVQGNIKTIEILLGKNGSNLDYKLKNGSMNFNKIQLYNSILTEKGGDKESALQVFKSIYTGLTRSISNTEQGLPPLEQESTLYTNIKSGLGIYYLFTKRDYDSLGQIYAIRDPLYMGYFYNNLAYLTQQDGLVFSAQVYLEKCKEFDNLD